MSVVGTPHASSGVSDRYRTRTGTELPPVERIESAVVGGVPGPMPVELVDVHESAGFSLHRGLLTAAEVERCHREVRRLVEDPAMITDPRTIVEPGSSSVRSLFEIHRLSPLIADLIRDPRLLGRARQVLGGDVYIHQSRVNLMPGFTGTGFTWHSDFETWHAEDGMPTPRAVSLSIALTDNYPFNGSLLVVPDSHRTFVPCAAPTPPANHERSLRAQEVGVPSHEAITALVEAHGISQFVGGAGDALLFDANLMHGSGNNITPFPRSNIFVVYNSCANTLVEPFAAPDRRPEYIAARDFAPLR